MATRFYLHSTGTADHVPLAPVGWSETTGFDILECAPYKMGTPMTSKTRATSLTAANSKILIRQYMSIPIAAQTIGVGTVKGTIRALESAINDNADAVTCRIWLASQDAQTNRGTILAIANSTVAEFSTSLRAKRIAAGVATSSVTAQDGDHIIIELGYTMTTGGTSVSADLNFGCNSATDLGDNETDTAANNPFVEFSVTIAFQDNVESRVLNTISQPTNHYRPYITVF
jgi:hypothetical protein